MFRKTHSLLCIYGRGNIYGIRNQKLSLSPSILLYENVNAHKHSIETLDPNKVKGVGWRLVVAVCVTRHPLLCQELHPIEQKFSQQITELEQRESVQSDFELRVMEDEARKVLGDTVDLGVREEETQLKSALENLDQWSKEEEKFRSKLNFSDSIPAGALGAEPTRQVVLVTKTQLGDDDLWMLPQDAWQPGETLRETSERIVEEQCDPALRIRILGNAPVGFFKYKYPKKVRQENEEGFIGVKMFFYRGYVGGNYRRSLKLLRDSNQEELWLSHDQLDEKLSPRYCNAVKQFLIDDS